MTTRLVHACDDRLFHARHARRWRERLAPSGLVAGIAMLVGLGLPATGFLRVVAAQSVSPPGRTPSAGAPSDGQPGGAGGPTTPAPTPAQQLQDLKRLADVVRGALEKAAPPVDSVNCPRYVSQLRDGCRIEAGKQGDRAGDGHGYVIVQVYPASRGRAPLVDDPNADPAVFKSLYQGRTPAEFFEAGARAWVYNQTPHFRTAQSYGKVHAIGRARADFRCGTIHTVVSVEKRAPQGYAGATESSPEIQTDITQQGELLKPAARERAQKIAQAYLEAFAREKIELPECGTTGPPPAPEVPELPLLIPAAACEGSLTPALTAKRQQVLQHLQAARVTTGTKNVMGQGAATGFDSLGFLVNWYDANRGVLDAERQARLAAEEFFPLLAVCYDRMTDAERAKLESGFSDRAFALRSVRGKMRNAIRAKAGLGTLLSAGEMNAYYGAVSRATWAALELESLVRMWGAVNQQRVIYHSRFDVHEVTDPRADPARLKATEAAQRHHLEALVDMGVAALLGSEVQLEVSLDAQKDRLFSLWDGFGSTGAAPAAPQGPRQGAPAQAPIDATRLQGLTVELFSLGFTVFDIAAGLTVDAFKVHERSRPGGLFAVFGIDVQTRAEKLDQKVIENWDRTQRKVVLLRLFKTLPAGDLNALAEAVARGASPASRIHELLRKQSNEDHRERVAFLMDDRAFVEATDGGLLRMLSTTLVDLPTRGRMNLRIAQEQTRLIRRDMEAALRLEKGLDPDTGDLAWGTILSPSAWANVLSKLAIDWLGPAKDLTNRAAAITLKAQQIAAMEKVGNALLLDRVRFRFEELPEDAWAEHGRLWAASAPYAAFVLKTEKDQQGLALHDWRRDLRPDLDRFPEASQRKAFYEQMVEHFSETAERAEQRRINRLRIQDCLLAWDLPAALSLAESAVAQDSLGVNDDAEARAYAGVAKLLREAIAEDRVKRRAIALLQNVGDIGLVGWAFKGFPLARDPSRSWTGFARYAWEVANPLARARTVSADGTVKLEPRAARAVFTQAGTEVLVDLGVQGTGEKYEALLNQVLSVAVDVATDGAVAATDRLGDRLGDVRQRIRAAAEAEKTRYAQLDAGKYVADLMDRAALRTFDQMVTFRRALAAAKDVDIRASIARQMAETKRLSLTWAVAAELSGRAKTLRAALQQELKDPKALRVKLAGLHRALNAAMMPPTRTYYEWVVTARAGDLFSHEKGLDIEGLRKDFKTMRAWARPEDRPALDRLETRIDEVRHERFLQAMGTFLTANGSRIEGVILNGTAPGNPEYKGLFSDKDFTIVVKAGVDPVDMRRRANEAFEKHGIVLNAKGAHASADIEAMVQEFLPGEVRPLTTLKDFAQWHLEFAKDPARYLSAGGGEWVGLYNYLNGATLSLQGGKAVVDAVPNPSLLKRPVLHPLRAHGLVLDAARFDKLRHHAAYGSTATLAEAMGTRGKTVLRAVDALIWTLRPDLANGRTREAAQEQGYHRLIVDEALTLHEDGVLSLEEYETIELLYDLKTGKTAVQALGLDAQNPDAGRKQLEMHWDRMNALMKRAYAETRGEYLQWLEHFAAGLGDDPKYKEVLPTLAYRNHLAARQVAEGAPFGRLAILTGHQNKDPLDAIKVEDQAVVGRDRTLVPTPEPPAKAARSELDRWLDREDDPATGTEPEAGPTVHQAAVPAAPAPAKPFADKSRTTYERYDVFDSSNPIRFKAFATLEDLPSHPELGVQIVITLRTREVDDNGKTIEESTVIKGHEQFPAILKHFAGRFDAVRGSWTYGTNFDEFNKNKAAGMDDEKAALETWTGRQATKAGFPRATVFKLTPRAGPPYDSISVVFHK